MIYIYIYVYIYIYTSFFKVTSFVVLISKGVKGSLSHHVYQNDKRGHLGEAGMG